MGKQQKKLTEKDCLNELEQVCYSIIYYKHDDESMKIKLSTMKCALEKIAEIRKAKADLLEERRRQRAAEAYGAK